MSSESQLDKSSEGAPQGVQGDALLIKSIMNSLRGKTGSDSGGNNSDTNNGSTSDNSALVSIGNSAGFNYDNEEGMSSNSDEGQNDNNDDSDAAGIPRTSSSSSTKRKDTLSTSGSGTLQTDTSTRTSEIQFPTQNEAAANAAVAHLQSIANSFMNTNRQQQQQQQQQHQVVLPKVKVEDKEDENASRKRRTSTAGASDRSIDEDSGGYNTDDDDGDLDEHTTTKNDSDNKKKSRSKKKRVDENKREERNQREKERSLRISKQIGELRNLLSSGGVVVPKGTKSSVLTEAVNYIRMLQQHHYRSEIDRHQLVQQMQLIGGGAHGPQAAAAIRHVAAQNGVWSLGNFGGVPPKSAMTFYDPTNVLSNGDQPKPKPDTSPSTPINPFNQTKSVDPMEYRFVFNSCGAGMAIASMGGAFIDCNQLFCQLSNYSKQEICSLTIFNLTARQDLQHAFDQISQLISPPMDDSGAISREKPKPVILQGAMKNRDDLGLSVSLVKGDDGVAKCFCVTIVKNRQSPFDTTKPVPVSFEAIVSTGTIQKDTTTEINAAPAFTSG